MSHVNVFILGLFLVISQHVRASTCDSESVEDSPNINAPENSMVLEDSPRLPTNNPWLPYYYYYATPMTPQFATPGIIYYLRHYCHYYIRLIQIFEL
jgi:hypothetical protein